ncbi:MAG: TonB-dependent receptor [Prevotella sp.]|nr:TonB-dependent receptor [Prevotella sp.]
MKRNIFLFCSLLVGMTALAETGNKELAADSSRVHDLDEVVVVSQSKEYLRLRHQPLSSSVLTGTDINTVGARDLRSMSSYIPSFVMPTYGSRYTSSIYVRGIGSRVNSPSMGVYLDDIPLMSKATFNSHSYELDRVDVLRGAQGTLYGINTEGGLVRQYTKNPMNYQGTDVRLGLGTHFYRNAEAAHYHKFSDRLALSLAAFYNGQNGFFRNQATGDRADESNEAGGRLRLVMQPSERLTVNLLADYQWVNQNGFAYGQLDMGTDKAADPSTNRQGTYKRNMLNTGLNMLFRGDWADLSYTLSWQYLKDGMLMDIDYRPQDYMHMEQAQLQNAITHELVLKTQQLGMWQGTTGFFFSHQWLKTQAPVYFDPAMNAFLSKSIEDYAYYGMLNSMAARMGQEAAAAMIERAGGCHITMDIETIPGLFRTPQTNYGLFHETNLRLTDRLTATLGLRYDITQTSIDYATSAVAHLDESVMGTQVQATVRSLLEQKEDASFEQWLPKVGLTWQLDSRGSNVYGIVSKGYRAGGFNIQMFSDILQAELQGAAQRARGEMAIEHDRAAYDNIRQTKAYKPEESWNFELGTHLNILDGLHLDLAAYYMQIRNQQLSVFASQYGFGRMMVNAGRSYSCGVEATLRGSAFDNRLSWAATYGYTHAVFKDYTDSTTVDGEQVAIDYKDKRVPFVPEHTLSARADYRLDMGQGLLRSLTFGANITAQGKTWWDEENTYGQKLYTVLGAHIDADLSPVVVSLWARNLANTNYNTFAIKSSFGGETSYFAQRGNPFQAGVDVRIHF